MSRRASASVAVLLLLTAASGATGQQPPLYRITTFAGSTFNGDGRQAATAVFVQPQCVAVDRAGNVYVSDTGDHRIRRIGSDGVVRTVAGNGSAGYKGDGGPASQAQLNAPYGMAVDPFGNLFIADLGNAVIRRVAPDGTIQTWAGGGRDSLPAGAYAAARTVRLMQPRDVTIDRTGNLVIADFGGHRVYTVTPGGTITVLAGTGEPGALTTTLADALKSQLAWPSAVAVDAEGMILVADSGNRRLRRIGFGNMWTVTDRGRREIEFGTPTGIATDAGGRIYVADGSTARTAVVNVAGDLSSVALGSTSVAVTAYGEVITVSERRVRKLSGGRAEVLAGQGAGDGRVPAEWRFSQPSAAVRDAAGSVWIADTGLGRIRRLSASGDLATVTTALDSPVSLAVDPAGHVWAGDRAGNGGVYRIDTGIPQPLVQGQNRPMVPSAMAFDTAGILYFADSASNLIRRVDVVTGAMTVVAGGGREAGDGQALQLKLAAPAGIAVDPTGTVWFSESGTGKLRKVAGGRVTTMAGTEFIEPRGLRFDRTGKLWIADARAHRVVVLDPADGNWYPVAGTGDKGLSGDNGLALAGMLNTPTDVWPEPDGSALLADTGNDRIRRLEKLPNDPDPPVVAPPPAGSLVLSPVQVLHAATLLESDVAPGQLAYIAARDLKSPEVTIGGTPASLLETSANRLTVQIPALAPGWVEVAVNSAGALYGKTALRIASCVPGILTAADGRGQALALNADGQVNGPDHPAERGSVITLFVTGDAGISPGHSGEIGGYPADILWSGPAPGMFGITQVNIQTPGGFAPSGAVSVSLAFDGAGTQPGVTIVSR